MGREKLYCIIDWIKFNEKEQPCAEWWLGAHPSAPSDIENVTGKQSLLNFYRKIRPH